MGAASLRGRAHLMFRLIESRTQALRVPTSGVGSCVGGVGATAVTPTSAITEVLTLCRPPALQAIPLCTNRPPSRMMTAMMSSCR